MVNGRTFFYGEDVFGNPGLGISFQREGDFDIRIAGRRIRGFFHFASTGGTPRRYLCLTEIVNVIRGIPRRLELGKSDQGPECLFGG